jgi:hypothetical protein
MAKTAGSELASARGKRPRYTGVSSKKKQIHNLRALTRAFGNQRRLSFGRLSPRVKGFLGRKSREKGFPKKEPFGRELARRKLPGETALGHVSQKQFLPGILFLAL